MATINRNTYAFLELLRAGLWEDEIRLMQFDKVDYEEIMRLSKEQSVVGLVTAGMEHVSDAKVPQEYLLKFIGQSLQLERRNLAMNYFIDVLVNKMREADIFTLLVKGQGIAQYYERPLWRTSGDIDFLLDIDNYYKAKVFLLPLAIFVEEEATEVLHLRMNINSWIVEIHGSLRSGCLKKMDEEIENVQTNIFKRRSFRVWKNESIDIFLPSPDYDVVIVFTHIIKHFFHGGIGLRQICDWCRLLWTFQDVIDVSLLEERLRKMKLMTEWKSFAALAVGYLGMPVMAMPIYDKNVKYEKKALKIMLIILETGSFGRNQDLSFYMNDYFIIRKVKAFNLHTYNSIRQFFVFPIDAVKVWLKIFTDGIKSVIKCKRD